VANNTGADTSGKRAGRSSAPGEHIHASLFPLPLSPFAFVQDAAPPLGAGRRSDAEQRQRADGREPGRNGADTRQRRRRLVRQTVHDYGSGRQCQRPGAICPRRHRGRPGAQRPVRLHFQQPRPFRRRLKRLRRRHGGAATVTIQATLGSAVLTRDLTITSR